MQRREFLKTTVVGTLLGSAFGSGLLLPGPAIAAWPKSAFSSTDANEALQILTGKLSYQDSTAITLTTPKTAPNGALVALTIETTLQPLRSINIITPGNTTPLAGSFRFEDGMLGYLSTNVKLAKTSMVIAVVETDKELFATANKVKVIFSNCG